MSSDKRILLVIGADSPFLKNAKDLAELVNREGISALAKYLEQFSNDGAGLRLSAAYLHPDEVGMMSADTWLDPDENPDTFPSRR